MLNHGRWLFALAGLTFGLLWPLVSRAEEWTPPSIIISEVNWAGSSKSLADEWLELTNLSAETISIGGWMVDGASENPITLPEDAAIGPSETFLIANYDETNEKSALAAHPNFVTTSVALSNSALKVTLKNSDGTIVDVTGNGEKPATGTTASAESGVAHASMARRTPLMPGDTAEAWATSETSVGFDEGTQEKGTPGTLESWFVFTDVTESVLVETTTDTVILTPEDSSPSAQNDTGTPDPVILSDSEESQAITATPTSLSSPIGTLVINEILPNPADGEEWVEIFNPYNNVIPLQSWKVRDASGRAADLPSQLLGWQQYVVVRRASGWLNNDAETVELIDPMGNVIDRVEYTKETKPEKGFAIMRNDSLALTITTTPTPGSPNLHTTIPEPVKEPPPAPKPAPTPPKSLPAAIALAAPIHEEAPVKEIPTPAPSMVTAAAVPKAAAPEKKPVTKKTATGPRAVKIRDLRDLRSGAKVVTEGVVTISTDTFGSQIIYIQSDGAGIQLFRVNGRLSDLKIGDRVRAEGVLGTSEGEQRIKIQNASGIQVLGSSEETPIGDVKLNELNEQHVGSLVKVLGSIAYLSGKKFMLESEDGEVWIAPTERVRLPPEIVVPGTALEITGIITTQNGELRLVPRSADEVRMLTPPPQVEILEPTGKERAQGQKETAAWTLTAAGLTTLLGLAIKHFFLKSI
jgi:hypothetical protein